MPRLLKNNRFTDNTWERRDTLAECTKSSEKETSEPASNGRFLLPLNVWREHRERLFQYSCYGLWLNGDDEPDFLADDIAKLACIAIHFPVFTDGRGFSLARLVRERYTYQGELRAVGNIGVDQLHFLSLCGFNTFELPDHVDLDTALTGLECFSMHYQQTL